MIFQILSSILLIYSYIISLINKKIKINILFFITIIIQILSIIIYESWYYIYEPSIIKVIGLIIMLISNILKTINKKTYNLINIGLSLICTNPILIIYTIFLLLKSENE